jgi:hypothetical protein
MLIPLGFAQLNAIHTGTSLPNGAQWTLAVNHDGIEQTPLQVAEKFEQALSDSNLYDNVSLGVTMTSVLCKFGPNDTGKSALSPANEPGVNGNQASPNTSYLVHKNTDDGGRAGRGRFFLPGVPDSLINPSGTIVSASISAINTSLATFLAALIAEDVIPVVLHNVGSPLSSPSPIESLVVDAVAATQRRRLRR